MVFTKRGENQTGLGVFEKYQRVVIIVVRLEGATIVKEMGKPLDVMHYIKPEYALNILRSCINARVSYLSRVSEGEYSGECLQGFDKRMDIALCYPRR